MKKTICILLLLLMMSIPGLTFAVTINTLEYQDNIQSGTFEDGTYDIRGVINENQSISTTYENSGYQVYFKVGSDEGDYITSYTGETITKDGVEFKITGIPSADNKGVSVEYSLKNTSSEAKQFSIATTADIDLAYNDEAAIYKDETSIILVTQDDEDYENSYGTQIKISFSPKANTTWIGDYSDMEENRYVNGEVISYTCDDYEDTGLAFSWSGTLEAGEETTYSAGFTIKEAEYCTVSFYKMGETEPFTTLSGLIGGSIITPEAQTEAELETGYKWYWNTKEDGTGTDYETEKGIIITLEEMKLYEVKKSLWHDVIIAPTDEMNIEEDDEFELLELLLEKELLKYEEKPEEDSFYIYNADGKFLFKVNEEGVLTLAEGLTYKDNIEYELTDEDKELLAEYEIYINKITLSFGNPPEPFEYKILEGAGQKHEIEDGKDIIVKTNGDISKLKELRVDNKALDKEDYTIEKGSTIATLKTAYLDTLSEGDHILTFVYEDGDVSTNFTIVGKPAVEEEPVTEVEEVQINNPKTGDNIAIWISIMIISILGIIVTKRMQSK